jgi:hypothetical protein
MTSVRRPWLALLAIISASMPLGMHADELHLSDGRVIEGEIISPAESDVIDIKVGAGNLVAVQHFPRAKVERVVYRVSQKQNALNDLHQRSVALAQREDATAEQWWTMARSFLNRGDQAGAKEAAAHTITLDRHHAEARKLLGMVKYHGVWMRANEAAVARGEVFFRGAWVTWSQQEQTLADEARRREEAAVARQERAERQRQARIAAAAAAEATSSLQETYVGGYYRSPYYNPYGGWYYNGRLPVYPGYPAYPIHPIGGVGGGCYTPGYSWHLGAIGGSSSTAWGLSWNGGSWGGTTIR